MSTSQDLRAYLNPQPALSEAEQKRLIEPYKPRSIYVESRNEKRENCIGSLRVGSAILLPELFVLAKANGRKDKRFADLLEAKDEIHSKGNYILEASSGHRSDNKKQWLVMRERAKDMLGGAVKKGKVGKPALGYTDAELKDMLWIADNRKHKNWTERVAVMKRRGMKVPGRTWFYTKLEHLARKRGLID